MALDESLNEMIRMLLFMNINNDKTNIYNTIIVLFLSYLFFNMQLIYYFTKFINEITLFFYKKNMVILEGKSCFKNTEYNTRTDQLFSDRFKAIWYYTINSININKSIYEIKEYSESSNIYNSYGDPKNNNNNNKMNINEFFIVHQNTNFKINENIYCNVIFLNQEIENENNNRSKRYSCNSIETIRLTIFSYKLSLNEITQFIDKITHEYIKNIKDKRLGKKFIYTYLGKEEENDEFSRNRNKYISWEECEFNSSRSFDNLFFDDKQNLIKKINFFENNKDWYDKEGHPWYFGLGLSGPPGSGKTSIIKSIANMLNRHIIIIPLNKIKTQNELSNVYFESTYNRNNDNESIEFKNKIIVFEDIDCMCNIVKKRDNNLNNIINSDEDKETKKMMKQLIKRLNKKNLLNDNDDIIEKDNIDNDDNDDDFTLIDKSNDKMTLSYILNLIDGIRETPGRIIIITSNYYDKLDSALIRPGRIDCTMKMTNASYDTINNMFNHYYQMTLEEYNSNNNFNLDILKNYDLSPADIVNIRLFSNTPDEFISNIYEVIEKKFK